MMGVTIFKEVIPNEKIHNSGCRNAYSPEIWREVYLPCVERMCQEFRKYNVKIIYHGCGNAKEIYDDLIAAGIDCYNPLEVKSGLDVVELKKEYDGRLAFWGGVDVRVLINGSKEDIKKEVLYRLGAAEGGGYIISSDHSVAGNVSPENYEYMINLVRQYGEYPLKLGNVESAMSGDGLLKS